MNKTLLIAKREIKERIGNRSFRGFLWLGPIVILLFIYLFLSTTTQTKKEWNILMMDQFEVLDGKLAATKPKNMHFDFINANIEYDEFVDLQEFDKYDIAVSINEKIVSNKQVIVTYKQDPPEIIKRKLIYIIERRVEELMVKEFTDLSVEKFRDIKQSLNFHFKDAYDPKNEQSKTASWVGFTFGGLIILFVFMFGMTILRSVVAEKSNRIVEILLSSVKPRQLLSGKVLGIGVAALFQLLVWSIIIAVGLSIFRLTLFPDLFGGGFVADALTDDDLTRELIIQSPFVELLYKQINYGNMLIFFVLFFMGGYIFYGSFFAMIGSSMGTESDGQQFIIPLNLLLLCAILSGGYAIYYPSDTLTEILSFVPFTSPMVMMIKLSNGFTDGNSWQLFLSLIVLLLTALLMMRWAGRIYKNGILRFNHRLGLKMLLKWSKK